MKLSKPSGMPTRSTTSEDGPFYEDLEPGQTLHHANGRTITDADNIWFTLLTCNTNQIHLNKDYVERNFANPPFNGRLVTNSLFVFSVVLGLSVNDTSKNGIMLGMTDWKAPNPTFAGDTIYSDSEVIEKRESKSHVNMALVTILARGFKQDKTPVIEFKRTFVVRKSGKEWR